MRLGVTEHVDCAHHLPSHPKCGKVHGHTYRVEVVVEGEVRDGMVLDFADIKREVRAVLADYDHADWNDVLDYPSVENICALLLERLRQRLPFALSVRVYEGHAKWAEASSGPEGRI
jgi:6-pyruvoyltetrahydropterin/6-carboxytetrahydropterin synthase